MLTLIRQAAETSADEEASHINVQAFNDSEVMTAMRNGSGNLELIGWNVDPSSFAITRTVDNLPSTDVAQEVALVLMSPRSNGRRFAITATRNGDDNLELISWEVPPGLGTITRIHSTGTSALEASQITLTAEINDTINDTMLVTAVSDSNNNLLVISWLMDNEGHITRLNDSTKDPSVLHNVPVDLVTIARVDNSSVITAVSDYASNFNGEVFPQTLKLIGMTISSDGSFHRWAQIVEAGKVNEIAIIPFSTKEVANGVITAVQDKSGDLVLIAWQLSAADGTITRIADSHYQAGAASNIAICSTVTSPGGTPTIFTSVRRGSDNLGFVAFNFITDPTGIPVFIRTTITDITNEANLDVRYTALCSLGPGRIITAYRNNKDVRLVTYTVSDAARAPEPFSILELQFDNPLLPSLADNTWATSTSSSGEKDEVYPLHRSIEWVQVLDRPEDYDIKSVGCSGWVVAPENSAADLPSDHPFGFDWEFDVLLDVDDKKGYLGLLSPSNIDPNNNPILSARSLGLPTPRGLLGMEWDQGLLPQNYRSRINHGDRVAMIGRWILDQGHSIDGHYRTEIHPPLLLATASIQRPANARPFTRMLLMSRPFLVGQTYSYNVADVYNDSVASDGDFLTHLIKEEARIAQPLSSSKISFHPKIKEHNFKDRPHPQDNNEPQRAHFIVRPPPRPSIGGYHLEVSFKFTHRNGCNVQVAYTPAGEIAVDVVLEGTKFKAPDLPNRTERVYKPDELSKLSPGNSFGIWGTSVATTVIQDLWNLPGVLLKGLWSLVTLDISGLIDWVHERLGENSIYCDEYEKLPEFNFIDTTNAVMNVSANSIPPNAGIIQDDNQPYPVFGWLEVKWVQNSVFPVPPPVHLPSPPVAHR